MGKQVEGRRHRKNAPNVPFPQAPSETYDLQVFHDHTNTQVTSGFQPSGKLFPGPGHYSPDDSPTRSSKTSNTVNFGKSAPRGLLTTNIDHRKINPANMSLIHSKGSVYRSKTTCFDFGRINPVVKERETNKSIGPGSFNPTPVRSKPASATFGAPLGGTVMIHDFVKEAATAAAAAAASLERERKQPITSFNDFTLRKSRTNGRNNCTSGVGTSKNNASGSFRSRAAIMNRNLSLPELLEETRKELYYKEKVSADYIEHDSAIGKQRLSRRKSAPKGVKW